MKAKARKSCEGAQPVFVCVDPERCPDSAFLTMVGQPDRIDANLDFSTTPADFVLQPDPGVEYLIGCLHVMVQANGRFRAEGYGAGRNPLTAGISVMFRHAGHDHNLTCSHPIRCNGDWAGYCFDTDVKSWGPGDEILVARWSFCDETAGHPVYLAGDTNDEFRVCLNDDLTGLVKHRFRLGYANIPA